MVQRNAIKSSGNRVEDTMKNFVIVVQEDIPLCQVIYLLEENMFHVVKFTRALDISLETSLL